VNPIKEWLARVATECGTPREMYAQGQQLKIDNSRRLVTQYAKMWQRRLEVSASVVVTKGPA